MANTRTHDFAVNTIVESCPNLKKLNLTGTYITDDAILKLQKLQHLQKLNISKTGITDKYTDKLLTFKKLQRLNVAKTHVSQKKLTELHRANPSLNLITKDKDD
jgi:Leucine-rich repeat (LRR) protein